MYTLMFPICVVYWQCSVLMCWQKYMVHILQGEAKSEQIDPLEINIHVGDK